MLGVSLRARRYTTQLMLGLSLRARFLVLSYVLAGQITRRVAPSVAPSTGCSIIILILFFRMNIVH